MDIDQPGAADYGDYSLMVDFTRRHGGGQVELARAEREKETKYGRLYQAAVTMRGAAFNEFGEMGPHAVEVLDRAVTQGVLHTGSHPDDLRAELMARLGAAVLFGNAAAFAHFATLNPGLAGWAPSKESLKARGQLMVTGVRGRLAAPARVRGRGRPSAESAAAAGAARAAAAVGAGGGLRGEHSESVCAASGGVPGGGGGVGLGLHGVSA